MKTLIIKVFICIAIGLSGNTVMGQTAELTIEVKEIKEAKGKILVSVKDSKDAQKMVYDMVAVEQAGSVTITVKNVPIGKVDVSLFQDLNENFKLDMDEQNIPIEPCYTKENVKTKAGENKLVVKLINVKELMSQRPQ